MSRDSETAALEERLRQLDEERSRLQANLDRLRQEPSAPAQPLGRPAAIQTPETPGDKIALFLSLFRCREDVFARLWENRNTGKKGYAPACSNEWASGICDKRNTKCPECPHRAFIPFDEQAVEMHLLGRTTIGSYAIRQDDTCTFLACDFDGSNWQSDVSAYRLSGNDLGVDVAVERSRSGNGAHAWVFFSEPVPAQHARRLGTLILSRALDSRPQISFRSYDRFFPSQDFLPSGGFGNLIALPLQKVPREKQNGVFLDSGLEPIPDQWEYLAQVRRLSPDELSRLLKEHTGVEPRGFGLGDGEDVLLSIDDRLLSVRDAVREQPLEDKTIALRVGAQLAVPLEGLPARLVSRLKRLAAFPNPEFYKLNRMRLSTFGHPRIIFGGEFQPGQLLLPRGILDRAVELLRRAGAEVEIQDDRPRARKIKVEFVGALTPDQERAVRALRPHEFGVFVAPPGAGKTVVACALIARRNVATLILVHRQQLVDQWRERLVEFLDIDPGEIGDVTGTRKKAAGKVDIAMLQTLSWATDLGDILPSYGQVIIDECHHIPAASFELVLRQLPVRFVLGLTATPYRKDGLQKIIHFQCGPIRSELATADVGALAKQAIVRETEFRLPPELGERPPVHVIWHYLVHDERRNEMIAGDVAEALAQGRTPLVISDRKDHLQLLGDRVRGRIVGDSVRVLSMDGGTPVPTRRRIFAELESALDQGQKVCLLSTASLIGEGFDLPRLDTLFLALPISFKGRMVQYVGRLHRLHEGKSEVRVYDYVDSFCAMTLKMYRKRLVAYRNMGYSVSEPPKMIGGDR